MIAYDENNSNHKYQFTESDRKKEKRYTFNFCKYIEVLSSMLKCVHEREHQCIFITITFPIQVNDQQANHIFTNFIDNMNKTYQLKRYVAVKEYQFKNKQYENNPHYHCIFDFPYSPIVNINRTFISCCENYLNISIQHNKNAVQLPKKFPSIVSDPEYLARYLAKYLKKSYKQKYSSQFLFMSKNLRQNCIKITDHNELKQKLSTAFFKKNYEYHTLYQIQYTVSKKIVSKKLRQSYENSQQYVGPGTVKTCKISEKSEDCIV